MGFPGLTGTAGQVKVPPAFCAHWSPLSLEIPAVRILTRNSPIHMGTLVGHFSLLLSGHSNGLLEARCVHPPSMHPPLPSRSPLLRTGLLNFVWIQTRDTS